MKYYGLIIPRSYNDYFSRSDPAAIRDVVTISTDAQLDVDSEAPIQNQAVAKLVPATASEENQLADKNFVNSTVGTNTAHYIYKTVDDKNVPFDSVEELEAYEGTVTPNDYAFVTGVDESGNVYFDRYKADVIDGVVSWGKEYRLNNSSFTAEQWAAIQSGITAELVAKIGDAGIVPITTADYNELPEEEKNADIMHLLTDAENGFVVVTNTVEAGNNAVPTSDAVNGELLNYAKKKALKLSTDLNSENDMCYFNSSTSNRPSSYGNYGICQTFYGNNGKWIWQYAYLTNGNTARRYKMEDSGNTWSAWEKLVTESDLKKTYNTTEFQISSNMNTNEFKNYILSHIAEWNNGDMIIITNTNQLRIVNLRLDKQTNQYFNILVTNYYMDRPCYMRYIGSSWLYNEL